ncbi:hypothetical protein SDC9_184194 [bioreactor metagenome]|uniref:Uncharacterized protein n=1 Tax=bioreactor metagenome TaxID=1076179 RepID=A0A645HKN5_9ZZZZ
MKPLLQKIDHRDGVLNHHLQIHVFFCQSLRIALARATLIETHDGTDIRQRGLIFQNKLPVADAGAAVQEQNDRILFLRPAQAQIQRRAIISHANMFINGKLAFHDSISFFRFGFYKHHYIRVFTSARQFFFIRSQPINP